MAAPPASTYCSERCVRIFFADLVEDFNGFGHHFRTDPIAFDYGYIVIHIFLHLLVFFLSGGVVGCKSVFEAPARFVSKSLQVSCEKCSNFQFDAFYRHVLRVRPFLIAVYALPDAKKILRNIVSFFLSGGDG